MMRRGIALLCTLLLLVLGGGCAEFRTVGQQELPTEQTALIAEHAALFREVSAASPFVKSLDGYADIWIKTPRRQNHLYGNIRINRGEEARMIVSAGLLGWPVADMFFSRDSLYVHDMLNNRLFLGSNSDENLEKMVGVRSGYRLFSDALLGLVQMTEPVSAIRSVKSGAAGLLFTLESLKGNKEALIDPATRTLGALILKDGEGRIVTEVHFRDYESITVEGRTAQVPKRIEMILYKSDTDAFGEHQLVIAYDERVFNRVNPSLRFTMPKKVKVFNLDESPNLPWM